MKKFFSFLITLFFYFLVYGALHEMFGESISLLHPSTKTDYLWGIISFSLMGILIFKRTYFPNIDTEEKASNQTEKNIVFLTLTTMLALSFYLFFGAVQLLLGLGNRLLHPFAKGFAIEAIVVLCFSFLFAYTYMKREN